MLLLELSLKINVCKYIDIKHQLLCQNIFLNSVKIFQKKSISDATKIELFKSIKYT